VIEATATQVLTVGQRRAQFDDWEQRIRSDDADYATSAWKNRALDRVRIQRDALGGLKDDDVLPTVRDVAFGHALLTDEQRMAVLWQHRHHLDLGEFTQALIAAADAADTSNLEKLARGYPALVGGITRWRNESGFADGIRALVADF
jgi:hypothetical protein